MLKNKNVWIILLGELVAGLGLWMGIIGNLEFLQVYVPSDFIKSFILFLGLLAGVLIGPLAGRIIDQVPKKKVLIYSGLGRMLSVSFMFLAIHFESIAFMILFMVTIQISAAFYFPALQATIPLIVNENDLIQMNGIHMNISTLARVAGTAIAGALLTIVDIEYLYLGSMVAYAIIFLLTFALTFDDKKNKNFYDQKSSSFKDILPVIKEIPIVLFTLVLTFIPMLFLGGFNLMVINISEIQSDISIKGLLYMSEGFCFMLGAFIVKRITQFFGPLPLMFTFAMIISITQLSLYFSHIKIMSLLSFGVFGFAVGCFFPIASTIFQTKIEKHYHGRFFSFRNMLDRVMFQVVLLSTGLFLDMIGMKAMVILFGVISLVASLLMGATFFRTSSNKTFNNT